MEHCGSRDDSLSWFLSRRHASTRLRMEEARLEAVSVPDPMTVGRTTHGSRRARKDTTRRRIATPGGGRFSSRSGCEGQEASIGTQHGRMGWSLGSRTCRISRLVSVLCGWQRKERDSSTDGSVARPWASGTSSELCLYGSMVREAKDRASPILVGKFSKDLWLLTHPVPCKGTHNIDGLLASS